VVVELLDGRFGLLLSGELDEGEAARPAGGAVGGEVDVDYLAGFGEQLAELVLGGVETEIADEDLGADGRSPSGR
jgi:hypothetical protein